MSWRRPEEPPSLIGAYWNLFSFLVQTAAGFICIASAMHWVPMAPQEWLWAAAGCLFLVKKGD